MKALIVKLNIFQSGYLVSIMTVTGVFAIVTALVTAWPALSYLGAKLV